MVRINFSEGGTHGGVIGIGKIKPTTQKKLDDLIALRTKEQRTVVVNRRTIIDDVFGSFEITEVLDDGIFVSGSNDVDDDRLAAEGLAFWVASLCYSTSEFIEAICKGFKLENDS